MKRTIDPWACGGFRRMVQSRRTMLNLGLKVGGLGLLGMNLPGLLRAEAEKKAAGAEDTLPARIKSVIFLFQFGGPSQIDMFDMKPDAPDGYRSPHKPIDTSADAIQISERLPRLAKVMNKVTLIRSMHHEMKNHNSASYYALTGHAPPLDDIRLRDTIDLYPAYGSMVDRLGPSRDGMPTFVALPYVIRDGEITPGQHASFLGKGHDPLLITEDPNQARFNLPELSLPASLPLDRLRKRRELLDVIDRQSRLLDHSAAARGLDEYYRKAIGMLSSPRVRAAFDLAAEREPLRESYGRHTYGQSCLLARRLVEAGVRFVTIYFSSNIGGQSTTGGGWDTHGFNNTRMYPIVEKYHLPITDQTLPVFLDDLDSRGLLEETLVVWMGEFGRTPKINANQSRDHWPQCYTVLLAGGGLKRGFAYGASDSRAEYPARDLVRPDDLASTMYYLLGIDPHTEVMDASSRPLLIADGKPILDLLA